MKKSIKNTVIILFSVLFLLQAVSCSKTPAAMMYGDSVITENEFRYYLATYKGNFSKTYSDFSDTDKFYNMELNEEGLTAGEYLYNTVLNNIKMTLICNELFENYDLKLSNSTIDTVDDYIDDFITEYASGNTNVFNSAL